MALQKQVVTIPFSGGINKVVDPVLVGADFLMDIENYAFDVDGRLTRRDGMALLPGSSHVVTTNGSELMSYRDELLAINHYGALMSYTNGGMTTKGYVSNCSTEKKPIAHGNVYLTQPDAATYGGFTMYVWNLANTRGGTNRGVYGKIIEDTTGAVVNDFTVSSASTALAPRVVANGSYFVVVWAEAGVIKTRYYTSGSSSGSTVQTVASDFYSGSGVLAATACTGGIAVAYKVASGSYAVKVATFAYAAGTIGTVNVVTAGTGTAQCTIANTASVGIAATGTTVAVAVGDAGDSEAITAIVSAADLAAPSVTHAATAVALGYVPYRMAVAYPYNAFSVVVQSYQAAEIDADADTPALGTVAFSLSSTNTAGTVYTFSRFQNSNGTIGPFLAGTPYYDRQMQGHYVPMVMHSQSQPTYYCLPIYASVLATQPLLPQVQALQGSAGRVIDSGLPATTLIRSTTGVSITCLELGTLAIDASLDVSAQGITAIEVTFGRDAPAQWHAQLSEAMYFSGAVPTMYDGKQCIEAGFLFSPEGVTAIESGTGTMALGTYLVCAVYEWTDELGRRQQSAPSTPVACTIANASKNIRMRCPSLMVGPRAFQANIVFYRTATGTVEYESDGATPVAGTIFYRDGAGGAVSSGWLINDMGLMSKHVDSSTTNAVLVTNEPLYTTFTVDAVLPHRMPPACTAIVAHQNRLFLGGLENPYEIWYSNSEVSGTGTTFSEALSLKILEGAGAVTALGSLDDKLIAYTTTRKFAFAGDGPDTTGGNGSYSLPQKLPGDTGCITQRSIANLADVFAKDLQKSASGGQVYQSQQGLFMLGRNMGDQFLGAALGPLLDNVSITSAVVCDKKSQLRLTIPAGILVFDYVGETWSLFKDAAVADTRSGLAPGCACVWNGLYTVVDMQGGNGYILKDTPGLYADFDNTLTTRNIIGFVRTPWYKASSMDGFQRLWRVILNLNLVGKSVLTFSVRHNYDPTTVVETFTISNTMSLGSAGVHQLKMHLAKQKFSAIQFVITDTPQSVESVYTGGCNLTGVSFEIASKTGVHKTPSPTFG